MDWKRSWVWMGSTQIVNVAFAGFLSSDCCGQDVHEKFWKAAWAPLVASHTHKEFMQLLPRIYWPPS
eukprot:2573190-Karenia_brevis.AAC.1